MADETDTGAAPGDAALLTAANGQAGASSRRNAAARTATSTAAPAQDTRPVDNSCAGLTAGDRRLLWVLGGVIIGLSVVHWGRLSGWGLQEVEIGRLPERRFDFRIDVNRATWVEWMQLEGIGELTARKIVAYREQQGPFRSIDDLDRVAGIGPKTLAAIRPWLECADCE